VNEKLVNREGFTICTGKFEYRKYSVND